MSTKQNEYAYKIIKDNGKIIKDNFKGNELELKKYIKSQNAYLIYYKKKKEKKRKVFNDKAMYVICKNLYIQIRSGINIKNAFKNISTMNSNKNIKNTFLNLYESIIKGNSIKDSIINTNFPREFISMISAGEISGTMDKVLRKLTDFYMYRWKIKKHIINKITYPLITLIIFNGIVLLIFSKILPSLNNVSGYNIKTNMKFIFDISNFVNNNFVITLIINIALYYLIYKFFTNIKVNKIPVLKNFIKKFSYLNFFTTFEILQNAGIKYDEILLICAENTEDNDLEEAAKNIRLDIIKGYGLTESFVNSNEFTKDINNILYNGEKSGDISSSLQLINEIYKEEFLDTLNVIIKLIEPFIILLIAVLIGIFVINIMVPIMTSFYEIG